MIYVLIIALLAALANTICYAVFIYAAWRTMQLAPELKINMHMCLLLCIKWSICDHKVSIKFIRIASTAACTSIKITPSAGGDKNNWRRES